PGGDPDPGRPLRLEHRPGAAGPVRLDADPAQATGGGEGGQDRGAADLPAGAVHLPRDLRRPGGTGGHQHHADDAEAAVTESLVLGCWLLVVSPLTTNS